jgi:hypothetical protein
MDHQQWLEQHDREMQSIRRMLRRAIRQCIREAREDDARHRSATANIDDLIAQLAAAQLITEEKLQRLIEHDERRYGGNGNPPAAQ